MTTEQDMVDATTQQRHAPWLPIPSRAISVVEHPCIVKNIDKGITSLGGPVKLSKVRCTRSNINTSLTNLIGPAIEPEHID
jgi:hypothetical protein